MATLTDSATTHPAWCSPAHCSTWTSATGAVTVDHAARPDCWVGTGAEVTTQLIAGDERSFPAEAPVPHLALTVTSAVCDDEATVFVSVPEARALLARLAGQLAAAEHYAADLTELAA